jgi:hypothetical protein
MTEAQKDRQHLLKHNAQRVSEVHRDMQRQGVDDPVIFIVDLRDAQGKEFWKATHQGTLDGFSAAKAHHAARREVPVLTVGLPRATAVFILQHFAPQTATLVRQASGGTVCVVASGGTTTNAFMGDWT